MLRVVTKNIRTTVASIFILFVLRSFSSKIYFSSAPTRFTLVLFVSVYHVLCIFQLSNYLAFIQCFPCTHDYVRFCEIFLAIMHRRALW